VSPSYSPALVVGVEVEGGKVAVTHLVPEATDLLGGKVGLSLGGLGPEGVELGPDVRLEVRPLLAHHLAHLSSNAKGNTKNSKGKERKMKVRSLNAKGGRA